MCGLIGLGTNWTLTCLKCDQCRTRKVRNTGRTCGKNVMILIFVRDRSVVTKAGLVRVVVRLTWFARHPATDPRSNDNGYSSPANSEYCSPTCSDTCSISFHDASCVYNAPPYALLRHDLCTHRRPSVKHTSSDIA